jgi:23S rRNA pseudouridine955/2504/2580 synthase
MKKNATGEQKGVRFVEVDPSRSGQRLDNFLLGQLKGVPRSHVYRLLRRGEVRVNGGRVKPDYRLEAGDRVRLPPVRTAAAPSQTGAAGFEWLNDRVLYEDDQLLVLDKPSGLAVHGGSGVSVGLIEAVRSLRPASPSIELAHRLDRDTSGCLILAKERPVLLALHRMFRSGQIDKRYLALIRGRWRGGPRDISAALQRGPERGGERRVEVRSDGEGREAASRFSPRGHYGPASLVEIQLHTGRTHQARVHAAHIGHPIAGDEKYGERDFNREMRELGLRRLFLHAASLRFAHPSGRGRIAVEAALPPELSHLLKRLRDEPAV